MEKQIFVSYYIYKKINERIKYFNNIKKYNIPKFYNIIYDTKKYNIPKFDTLKYDSREYNISKFDNIINYKIINYKL